MEREIFSPEEEEAAKNKERTRLRAEFQEGVHQREEEKRRKQLAAQEPFTEEIAEQSLSARKERLQKEAERRQKYGEQRTQYEEVATKTEPFETTMLQKETAERLRRSNEDKWADGKRRGHRRGVKPRKPGREATRKEATREAA